ncbi:metallo-beta-lactamase family protein [Amycolatopsis lexingtonensis]|uniref:Metallo-beta-lactamase family protein n=1 Tax=Amycolatopsis lexingtonensis TaxID=218822 RepID=A0ABR9HSK6_9PSEU|nr:MBL fold metallo-hydrolase [Amycolatopsis lexingtonensis]MBE1493911.1 metallo-beta-lactamase family protein [Amycolatopsis lexingtonensis]
MPQPALTFFGGAGTVTGSKYLVEAGGSRVLVDCGLFQGLAKLRRRNWAPIPRELTDVDAVVITHAHLDHCGYLPVLVRSGWHGPVYVTHGSAGLVPIVLRDSAHLMTAEAAHANAYGWSKHRPALPLYDENDAAKAIRLLKPIGFGDVTTVAPGVRLEFGRAGHILGSAWAHLRTTDGRGIVFSGDLGRPAHGVLRPPQPRPACDALVLESTYGARTHDDASALATFADVIRRTTARGGSVLIPAFAVDRTEVVLAALKKLTDRHAIPELPIFVDSPMALAALRVYRTAMNQRWPEIRTDLGVGDPLDPGHLVELRTTEESMRVNDPAMPSIILSASGMATGGRVLHHLEHLLPDDRHTVLIVGYAAAGTRARNLANGAREIKIHGRYVPVRAEVAQIDAFSAHADADELVRWAGAGEPPGAIHLVHGEPESAEALADRLRATHPGFPVSIARDRERVLI